MARPAGGMPGIVLAGGASRRMGSDKALVRLGGRPLVAWTVERLAPQCGALAISRHDGWLDGVALDLPILADAEVDQGSAGAKGRAGPLAGLLAALDWAAAAVPGADRAVTVAVDSPFLPADLVVRLSAAGGGAAVACSGGRRHPVVALWPLEARHALRAAMRSPGSRPGAEGLRRVGAFLDRLAPVAVEWPAAPLDPFANVNTPQDLAAAEAMLGRAC